jgi:hypothetical protein
VYSVRIRRLTERARLEGMLALRKAVDGVTRRTREPVAAESTWWRPVDAPADDEIAPSLAPEAEPRSLPAAPAITLTAALQGIAESIDALAAQLDAYHVERVQHLDAIEFLLRELVIGSMQPTAAPPLVLGGVVEPLADDEIVILPDGGPLVAGRAVEVRSRFHDRWISGFSIAEVVDEPTRMRYRLTRRSDGIPLPILFDACDVRAGAALDPGERIAPDPQVGSEPRAQSPGAVVP